ncbi:MAG: hypothetical protein R3B89_06510 [Polyangiaceae bacterium]
MLGRTKSTQGDLFDGYAEPEVDRSEDRMQAKETLLDRLERFLNAHTSGDDLGLRLAGEQLASGVRFLRLVREGSYDGGLESALSRHLQDGGTLATSKTRIR